MLNFDLTPQVIAIVRPNVRSPVNDLTGGHGPFCRWHRQLVENACVMPIDEASAGWVYHLVGNSKNAGIIISLREKSDDRTQQLLSV